MLSSQRRFWWLLMASSVIHGILWNMPWLPTVSLPTPTSASIAIRFLSSPANMVSKTAIKAQSPVVSEQTNQQIAEKTAVPEKNNQVKRVLKKNKNHKKKETLTSVAMAPARHEAISTLPAVPLTNSDHLSEPPEKEISTSETQKPDADKPLELLASEIPDNIPATFEKAMETSPSPLTASMGIQQSPNKMDEKHVESGIQKISRSLNAYLRNIDINRYYPRTALRRGIEGHVELAIVFDVTGRVNDVQIAQEAHGSLNEAALELLHDHAEAMAQIIRDFGGDLSVYRSSFQIRLPVHFMLQK
ncbi:MAG: TonB family protein [SAR324 cluster bacterium]|nr:TonB family protein [SAR324 cluster bacterium]